MCAWSAEAEWKLRWRGALVAHQRRGGRPTRVRSLVNLGIPILETDFVLCWMTDELRNGAAETDSEIGADDLGDGRVEE